MRRRSWFAASLVITVAACGGGTKGGSQPSASTLPEIAPEALEQPARTCDGVLPGDDCDEGDRCDVEGNDGCGLTGYNCRDGKWSQMMTACNPPPPS